MLDLAAASAADFEPAIGSVFSVVLGGAQRLEIRLTSVVRFPGGPGSRQPFALRFAGPDEPVLAQITHRIVHPELGEFVLFLGPVVATGDGVTYEAVFA